MSDNILKLFVILLLAFLNSERIYSFTPSSNLDSVNENILKESSYSNNTLKGSNVVYLSPNLVNGKNVLTQDMISKAKTYYIIQYDYDLNGIEIIIPYGCVLDFQGGSFYNGAIVFNNTTLNNNIKIIAEVKGTITNDWVSCKWFGLEGNGSDETDILQKLLNWCDKTIEFHNIKITTSSTIYLTNTPIRNLNIYNISNDLKSAVLEVVDFKKGINYYVPYVDINGLSINSKNMIQYGLKLNKIRYSNLNKISITGVKECIYISGIFISTIKDVTLSRYTSFGVKIESGQAGSTSLTIENLYSVNGKGYVFYAYNLDYSRLIKFVCDNHESGNYLYFEKCQSVQVETVGSEASIFNQILVCDTSTISFKNLCFLKPSINGTKEIYFLRCSDSHVIVETAYIQPLQNSINDIAYPRGFFNNGGKLILVNVSNDGIIYDKNMEQLINNKVTVLGL